MNFDHVNKISDYCHEQLMPHITIRIPVVDFGVYISKMVDTPSCRWMRHELRAFPINYFVDPVQFVKKYSKKCVSMIGTTNPQDGAFNLIYQISPTLHILARIYHWMEQEKVRAYLMLTCAFRDQEEFNAFFEDNIPLRMIGNTEDKPTGFGGYKDNGRGADALLSQLKESMTLPGFKGGTERGSE
jgi:hypothetical protein